MLEGHEEATRHNILYCFQNPPNQQDLSSRSELADVEYFLYKMQYWKVTFVIRRIEQRNFNRQNSM